MEHSILENTLNELHHIPRLRFFEVIGSTNDEALSWAAVGAEDGCLVVANQQTKGRGRFQRRWITQPGAGLAFSLILQPTAQEREHLGLFSPLGALGICHALENTLGLNPQIKWPNDVLLNRRKVAGILVESAWLGSHLQGVVIGIGINVTAQSVPLDADVLYPASSVENAANRAVDPYALLRNVLQGIFTWRAELGADKFLPAWQERLAFIGEMVRIEENGGAAASGEILGIDASGALRLRTPAGEPISVMVGDVHVRPING